MAETSSPSKIFLRIAKSSKNIQFRADEALTGDEIEIVENLAANPQELLEEVVKEQEKEHRFVILPGSRYKARFDLLVIVATIYVAVLTPYNVAFMLDYSDDKCSGSDQADNCYPPFFFGLDVVCDLILAADIILMFLTAYHGEDLKLVTNVQNIATKYAKSFLVYDVLAIIPFNQMAASAGSSVAMITLKALLLFRLFRLLRIVSRIGSFAIESIVGLLKLIGVYFVVGHWMGCALYFVSRWQIESLSSHGLNAYSGYYPWILSDYAIFRTATDQDTLTQNELCNSRLSDDFTWQKEDYEWTLYCADIRTKYSFSLYFAITTMTTTGYGDIVPMTNIERNFAMLFEVIGSLIAALFFANMAVLISGMDTPGDRLREKMADINHYIKTHDIPEELGQRMKDAVEYWWQIHNGLNVKDYLADLPESLRIEIFSHIQKGCVEKCAIFKGMSDAFLRNVTLKLHPISFLPKEVIYSAGEADKRMFFIAEGYVEFYDNQRNRVVKMLKDKDHFGEFEALFGSRCLMSAKAATACEMFYIEDSDFQNVLNEFPEYVDLVKQRILEKVNKDKAIMQIHRRASLATVGHHLGTVYEAPRDGYMSGATTNVEALTEEALVSGITSLNETMEKIQETMITLEKRAAEVLNDRIDVS